MKTRTFRGPLFRVQLLRLDASEPVTYAVTLLANRYPTATAFRGRQGVQVYYGEDLDSAWEQVLKYAPGSVRPVFRGRGG